MMTKQLVTAIGLVASLGIIALGVLLVALPLYFQSVGVDAQTTTVAGTNTVYQAQVDGLRAQQKNLDGITADVAELRSQLPSSAQLDDVFEVVGRAAEASGVSLTAVTAGDQVAYVVRTGITDDDAAAPAESTPTPTADPTDATAAATEGTDAATPADTAPAGGRQQVDFVISATAADMAQATAFLDALRAGPRLLSTITATTTQTGEGTVDVQIAALTFMDEER
jgi:hypothetical protein